MFVFIFFIVPSKLSFASHVIKFSLLVGVVSIFSFESVISGATLSIVYSLLVIVSVNPLFKFKLTIIWYFPVSLNKIFELKLLVTSIFLYGISSLYIWYEYEVTLIDGENMILISLFTGLSNFPILKFPFSYLSPTFLTFENIF